MGKFTGEFRAAPWLPENATGLLDQLIQPEWNIVETGAGASTFWLAARARIVTSFEHKPDWAEAVREELERRGLDKVAIIFHFTEYPRTGLDHSLRLVGIEKYDLALIDGRGRVRSIESVMPFIKPGGWIVLDNANRPRYEKAHQVLAAEGWKTCVIEGLIMPEKKRGFTQFWRKPFVKAPLKAAEGHEKPAEPETDDGEDKGA